MTDSNYVGLVYDADLKICGYYIEPNVFVPLTDTEIDVALRYKAMKKHDMEKTLAIMGEITSRINELLYESE